jgi:hypothetical protein
METRHAAKAKLYNRLVANRRTNLGVLVLLNALLAFGMLATTIQAGAGNEVRFWIASGITMAAALASLTFSVLVIRKARQE